jgi:hypothetical protein
LLNAWALTSRLRTVMPFNWPNKASSSACTLAHIPDIIIAAMRGKVRWRSGKSARVQPHLINQGGVEKKPGKLIQQRLGIECLSSLSIYQ